MRLLEQRGPGALRIRDVADAAEQSTMGVYTHFGSKQGLLEQLYLHGFERLEERLSGVPSDGRDRQGLRGFGGARSGGGARKGCSGAAPPPGNCGPNNGRPTGPLSGAGAPDFVPSDASRM